MPILCCIYVIGVPLWITFSILIHLKIHGLINIKQRTYARLKDLMGSVRIVGLMAIHQYLIRCS